MRSPTPGIRDLIEIFNIETKRHLYKHCSKMVVHRRDLVALIISAKNGVFYPYKYANFFDRYLPEHLFPSEKQIEALENNGVGSYKSKAASKVFSKLMQLKKQHRTLAAHLFYTPGFQYWHLFYFDNHDVEKTDNHWKYGPHIHLVNYLWSGIKIVDVWDGVQSGNLSFSNKIHLKFTADD